MTKPSDNRMPVSERLAAASPSPDLFERFELEETYGWVASRFKPVDLTGEIKRLCDPSTASETVHWGRNYLYRTHLTTPDGQVDVVVKQFRNQGLLKRMRRRWHGTKATRSWRMAKAFKKADLPTAEPVLLIESKRSDGPSFFVTRHLEGVIEARYLLRAVNEGLEMERFPWLDMHAFLGSLGLVLRQMHESGFFHRDLSIGNVLIKIGSPSLGPEDLFLIDLNRARHKQSLSLIQRTRDLCRLAIFRPEHQRFFLRAYWKGDLDWLRTAIYNISHHGFHSRIRIKKAIRSRTKYLWGWLLPRRAHAHIPDAPDGADRRDKIVWDHLSDQPHQHAGRLEKLSVRLADTPSHLRQTATLLGAGPSLIRRYRQLKRELYRDPVAWNGVGICVRPFPEAPDKLLAAIDDLEVNNVLVRLHPWEDDHEAEVSLCRELSDRGFELAFALPQNRDLVRDPARWRDKITELAELFTPFGRHFQIGQAINRSKWGIWKYGEYVELASVAASILRQNPGVELLGPAVIDFEYHVTASILNLRSTDLHFDILSSLLYVDRRGAPERPQLGFDTVGKVLLLKAIAETAKNCGPRSWVTEVNWPLWEGPHSPAGRTVSVDPKTQADYLARYYILALSTGAVERVYWWQLVARGYGLVAPGSASDSRSLDWVRRPGFDTLKTLNQELLDSVCLGPVSSPPKTHLFLFRRSDGTDCVAAWSSNGDHRASLPRPTRLVIESCGKRIPIPESREIEVTSAVRYFRL